jgi:Zn-dependent M32 family carboxypeptidase
MNKSDKYREKLDHLKLVLRQNEEAVKFSFKFYANNCVEERKAYETWLELKNEVDQELFRYQKWTDEIIKVKKRIAIYEKLYHNEVTNNGF